MEGLSVLKDMLPVLIPVVLIEVTLLSWGNLLLEGGGKSYWVALAVTVALTIASIWLAQRWLRTKDF